MTIVRCQELTLNGRRCKRRFDSDHRDVIGIRCYQHTEELIDSHSSRSGLSALAVLRFFMLLFIGIVITLSVGSTLFGSHQ